MKNAQYNIGMNNFIFYAAYSYYNTQSSYLQIITKLNK